MTLHFYTQAGSSVESCHFSNNKTNPTETIPKLLCLHFPLPPASVILRDAQRPLFDGCTLSPTDSLFSALSRECLWKFEVLTSVDQGTAVLSDHYDVDGESPTPGGKETQACEQLFH